MGLQVFGFICMLAYILDDMHISAFFSPWVFEMTCKFGCTGIVFVGTIYPFILELVQGVVLCRYYLCQCC